MKKLLILATVVVASTTFAEFPGPMPTSTVKLAIRQAVAEAKAYTYSKAEADVKFDVIESKLHEALARVKILEKTTTPAEGVTGIVAEPGQTVTVNDATKDAVIGGTIDTGSVSLTAKSVDVDNLTAAPQYGVNGMGILIDSPTISVADSTVAGPTQKSSNLIEVHNADTMEIKDTTFTGQTYNTIMTGQRTTSYLKTLTIENCVFDEDCKHLSIWFGGFQDNAVLTIKNCTFKTCEQFLCVSDYQGAGITNSLTINLENVTIANYETGTAESPDQYEGIILFDDRVYTSSAAFRAGNPFSKVTINIKNVTAKGQKITASNFVMGSGAPGQMLYLYSAAGGGVYPMNAANVSLFPTVNVVE